MDIFSKEIDVALWKRVLGNTKALHKPSLDDETAEAIIARCSRRRTPLLYVGGGILLADAATEMRELAEHLSLPVAHTLMGKGALPDDHPLILGMTGFWGTKFINDKCTGADWILGLGTRFSEADCSSWEDEVHLPHAADEADPHRHRPGRDRPQLSRWRSAPWPTSSRRCGC